MIPGAYSRGVALLGNFRRLFLEEVNEADRTALRLRKLQERHCKAENIFIIACACDSTGVS